VFHCSTIESSLPWASARFDLIIASYSLYFFVDALPDIARLLRPSGWFLVITHSERYPAALSEAFGLGQWRHPSELAIDCFSTENGRALLAEHFRDVEHVPYNNLLRFDAPDLEDLMQYARFKLPELVPHLVLDNELWLALEGRLAECLRSGYPLVIEKNDGIFRCRGPKGE
jgi:SAM-dependent methyltransferase